MKVILSVFVFLMCFSTTEAQTNFSGKYKFYSEGYEPGSLFLRCDQTFVMEDTMFVSKDSSVTSLVKGRWEIKKSQSLVLHVDSVISNLTPFGNVKTVTYHIREGRFFLDLPSKKQYEKENRKLDKKFPENAPSYHEDYETYKAKQNERYFFMIEKMNCN